MPCTGYFRITAKMLDDFQTMFVDYKNNPLDLSPEALSRCRDVRHYLGKVVTKKDLERMRK